VTFLELSTRSEVTFRGNAAEVNGVRVDAIELRDLGNSTRALGIVIALREIAERPREKYS